MSARVFGVGFGVFLVAFIWIIALLVCAANGRAMGADGAILPTLVATIFTLVLIFLPRETLETGVTDEFEIIDEYFIPRVVLLIAVLIFLLGAFLCFVGQTVKTTINARAVKPPLNSH